MPIASGEIPLAEFFMSAAGLRIALELSRLFGRRRPVRRSDLRRGSGLGRRGPARSRSRRGQCSQLHLDGRRFACDHGPVAAFQAERADGASRSSAWPISQRRPISSAVCPRTSLAFCLRALWRRAVPARGRGTGKPRADGGGRTCLRSITSHGSTRRSSSRSWTAAAVRGRSRFGKKLAGAAFSSNSPRRARSIPSGRSASARSSARPQADAGSRYSSTAEAAVSGQLDDDLRRGGLIAESSEALVTPVRLAGAERTIALAHQRRLRRQASLPESDGDDPPAAPARRARRSLRGRARRRAAGPALLRHDVGPAGSSRSTFAGRCSRRSRNWRRRAAFRGWRSRIR